MLTSFIPTCICTGALWYAVTIKMLFVVSARCLRSGSITVSRKQTGLREKTNWHTVGFEFGIISTILQRLLASLYYVLLFIIVLVL